MEAWASVKGNQLLSDNKKTIKENRKKKVKDHLFMIFVSKLLKKIDQATIKKVVVMGATGIFKKETRTRIEANSCRDKNIHTSIRSGKLWDICLEESHFPESKKY